MQRKPDEIFGISLCALSGLVILLSLVFPIISSSTILELFALRHIDSAYWFYLIPLCVGGFIVVSSALLFIKNRGVRLAIYVLLILSMNFIFYFLLRVIEAQSQYIWEHSAVYLLILSICMLLVGLVTTFSAQLKKKESICE